MQDLQVRVRIHGHVVEVDSLIVCDDADARRFRIGEVIEALFNRGDDLVKEAIYYGS